MVPAQPLGFDEVIRSNWSTKGWTKGQVTLLQAFGYTGPGFKFPSFQPQLPNQVSASRQNSSGGSGARGGSTPSPGSTKGLSNQQIAQKMVTAAFGASQWPAFNNIVGAEDSTWSVSATNPTSGAYGIPQALPGSKMASAGADWRTNPVTQIKWMIGYIRSTYGNPNNAWAFHLANGWY